VRCDPLVEDLILSYQDGTEAELVTCGEGQGDGLRSGSSWWRPRLDWES
jgi:hypothetical protein